MKRTIFNTVLTVGAVIGSVAVATPARANDNYCRDFNQEIRINGDYEYAYGRACLQSNGTWKIVSTDRHHKHDDHKTSHYTIKKTKTYTAPLRVNLYWGHDHHYHARKHYRKGYRHAKRHYHHHKKYKKCHHGHKYHH